MNTVFARNYWALALRVSPVIWATVSRYCTLHNSMVVMAKTTGFSGTGPSYRYECHTRAFSKEERGFVIADSFEYLEYGHWESQNEEQWRVEGEQFLLNGRSIAFEEWMKSYKEKNELLAFIYKPGGDDDDSSLRRVVDKSKPKQHSQPRLASARPYYNGGAITGLSLSP